MTFSPRMESRTLGFSPIHDLKWRAGDGLVADVWDVSCADGAEGHYVSPDPRLFVVLELEGDGAFSFETTDGRSELHRRAPSISYVPPGVALRGRATGLSRIKHLDLHIEAPSLTRRFGAMLDQGAVATPRLHFVDERLASLARLVAQECASELPLHSLAFEGLLNALLGVLFDVRVESARRRMALSRQQLALVTEFIRENCLETIRLSDLARLTGLSETTFSHAFKASTGIPPHRWHMHARLGRAQEMLLTPGTSIPEVATASGFSDQAHFTRVFKKIVGTTPAAWLRG